MTFSPFYKGNCNDYCNFMMKCKISQPNFFIQLFSAPNILILGLFVVFTVICTVSAVKTLLTNSIGVFVEE